MLDKEYNTTQWTHVYTDGSAEQAIKNGGSGIYIQLPTGENISKSLPTEKLSTKYRAEQIALLEAVNIFSILAGLDTHLFFLTDCKSVLETVMSPAKTNTSGALQRALSQLSQTRTIALQWIPSHCDISGNEEADRLSKAGSKRQQLRHPISYPEAKTLIQYKLRQEW
ncbi:uncharacterized protein LOC121368632 [Gigantopelta aegis]|uniref:uncharacterized protein LOC121368632 n=1 Tax=Gigantopelta aegis TaxID=1735272 RepID=UPI001B88BE81|nr:uncharacterized protein LOC121368632 [Gigantopelta aegis]